MGDPGKKRVDRPINTREMPCYLAETIGMKWPVSFGGMKEDGGNPSRSPFTLLQSLKTIEPTFMRGRCFYLYDA